MESGLTQDLEKAGYIHLPGFYSQNWASQWRGYLRNLSGESVRLAIGSAFKWGYQGAVSLVPALSELLFDERLLDEIRDAFGCRHIAYAEGSDAKVWQRQLATGWHRDGLTQQLGHGDEWEETVEPYRIMRIALYI